MKRDFRSNEEDEQLFSTFPFQDCSQFLNIIDVSIRQQRVCGPIIMILTYLTGEVAWALATYQAEVGRRNSRA